MIMKQFDISLFSYIYHTIFRRVNLQYIPWGGCTECLINIILSKIKYVQVLIVTTCPLDDGKEA